MASIPATGLTRVHSRLLGPGEDPLDLAPGLGRGLVFVVDGGVEAQRVVLGLHPGVDSGGRGGTVGGLVIQAVSLYTKERK